MTKHIELDFKTLSKLASEAERGGDYKHAAN